VIDLANGNTAETTGVKVKWNVLLLNLISINFGAGTFRDLVILAFAMEGWQEQTL